MAGPDGFTVAVRDTGVGIKPEDLEVALIPFEQIHNAMIRREGGSGLGLPIVKSLIELHGGRVSLESTVGVGTRVTLHVPPTRMAAGVA